MHRSALEVSAALPMPAEIHARSRRERYDLTDLHPVGNPAMVLALNALLRVAGEVDAGEVVMSDQCSPRSA